MLTACIHAQYSIIFYAQYHVLCVFVRAGGGLTVFFAHFGGMLRVGELMVHLIIMGGGEVLVLGYLPFFLWIQGYCILDGHGAFSCCIGLYVRLSGLA